MMKNVKIKSTKKFSLFQKFDEKFESINSNFKKRMLTRKLMNIIKNNVQFNKFMKKNIELIDERNHDEIFF